MAPLIMADQSELRVWPHLWLLHTGASQQRPEEACSFAAKELYLQTSQGHFRNWTSNLDHHSLKLSLT